MGNQPTTNLDIDLLQQFKQLKKDNQGILLQHKTSHLTYLLKQFTFASDLQYQHERNRLEREIEQEVCEHTLRVYKVKTHTIQGLCSTTHKMYAIYQYPQVTLQDEILARTTDAKQFDENQLWSILQSCTTALTHSRTTISLNTHSVFITQDGVLKVLHPDMTDDNHRYSIDPKQLYAPQKINNFNNLDTMAGVAKEAVFSMAMTVLQAALLQTNIHFYDFEQNRFLDFALEEALQEIEENYSADFAEIMSLMLSLNPLARPSLNEVQKLLQNYWNSISQQNQQQNSGQRMKTGQNREVSDKGIINNLVTINSQQKDSLAIQYHSNPKSISSNRKSICGNKISESVPCATKTPPQQLQSIRKTVKNNGEELRAEKQNIYTDPKLLAMIRQDLDDIGKLKQSTLKETIKYSFLYPESDAIFKSIEDVKLPLREQSRQKMILQESMPSNVNEFSASIKQNKPSKECPKEEETDLVFQHLVDSQGHEYQGYTLNGLKHGRGKLLFQDGAFYEGQFKEDQINGEGVLFYNQSKPAYDGTWVGGQFHGQGILYNQNPQKLEYPFDYRDFDQMEQFWFCYTGAFDFDNKCGRGRLQLTNGEVIEAVFENDMINGEGCFYAKNGEVVRGVWHMNRLVSLQQ